ncbi:hypothetical protein BX616_000630, partial [Lobosporangium transversale]
LRNSGEGIKDSKILTAPEGRTFPVAETQHLYIREEYKELYDHITANFNITYETASLSRIFVTRTPGVGKSAFLHDEENPPIIIFHEKKSTRCYAYGGITCQRYGERAELTDFLEQPEMWYMYLVDNDDKPRPDQARTVFSASPRTLNIQYDVIVNDTIPSSHYHMSPWSLPEPQACRDRVLQAPSDSLRREPNNISNAKKSAFQRVRDTINELEKPADLMANMKWKSPLVESEIIEVLQKQTWSDVLGKLVRSDDDIAKGPLFEIYVRYSFQRGDIRFPFKDLQSGLTGFLDFLAKPKVVLIGASDELSGLTQATGKLFLPSIPNFPCIDFVLEPDKLFQVTISEEHPIIQAPFKEINDYIAGPCSKINQSKSKGSDNAIFLYFVVPGYRYDDFKVQNFVINNGQDAKAPPGYLKRNFYKASCDHHAILCARKGFIEPYDTIIKEFCKNRDDEESCGEPSDESDDEAQNHIIITGTAGIGNYPFSYALSSECLPLAEDPSFIIIQGARTFDRELGWQLRSKDINAVLAPWFVYGMTTCDQ